MTACGVEQYPSAPGGGGEANTASNVGSGITVFKQKTGVDFELKTGLKDILTGTDNFTIPYRYLSKNATGTDAYVITTGLTLVTGDLSGMNFSVSFANNNTGAATLNIDGIGAKAIVKNGSTALVSGDLVANRYYNLVYDGTNFQISNVVAAAAAGEANTASNVGGGIAVFKQKTGVDFEFKTGLKDILSGTNNITIPWRFLQGSTTGTDTYALTTGKAVIEADLQGMLFSVIFGSNNTGGASLNVDGIGVKTIFKNATTTLEADEIVAGKAYLLSYDGTNFQMINIVPDFGTGVTSVVTGGLGCFDVDSSLFDLTTFAEVTAYSSLKIKNTNKANDGGSSCSGQLFEVRKAAGTPRYGTIVLQSTGVTDLKMHLGLSDRTDTSIMRYPLSLKAANNSTLTTPSTWGAVEIGNVSAGTGGAGACYITNSVRDNGGGGTCEKYGLEARGGLRATSIGYQCLTSTDSTHVGYGPLAGLSTTNNSSVGKGITPGASGVEIGLSVVGGTDCITIGALATNLNSLRSVLIGKAGNSNGFDEVIGLGANVDINAANTFIAGSVSEPINHVWFGTGETCILATSTIPVIYHTAAGTGNNIKGKDFIIELGANTGTPTAGGAIWAVDIPDVGAAAATPNPVKRRLKMGADGSLVYTNQVTVSSNFRKMDSYSGVSNSPEIWVSNETNPNTTITAPKGSICLNASATGQTAYNTDGSTAWTLLT